MGVVAGTVGVGTGFVGVGSTMGFTTGSVVTATSVPTFGASAGFGALFDPFFVLVVKGGASEVASMGCTDLGAAS